MTQIKQDWCVFGEDEYIQSIRNRLPEPYDYPYNHIFALDRRKQEVLRFFPFRFEEIKKEMLEPIPKIEFEKIKYSYDGVVFFAWTHNGEAYL